MSEQLKKDLIDMMKMYQIAIERGGVSESVSQNISFDQDQLSTGYEKKIIKHIRNEWYRYIFDTIVVIVGILIAFTLNNWNEKRNINFKKMLFLLF